MEPTVTMPLALAMNLLNTIPGLPVGKVVDLYVPLREIVVLKHQELTKTAVSTNDLANSEGDA